MADLRNAGRIEVHASPRGSLAGDGTLDYPVRTLERALDIARAAREPGQTAIIWMHEGCFSVTETIRLNELDSNTTFAAWKTDNVSVEGGVNLQSWERDTFRGTEIWTATAPQGAGRSLFVDGVRAARPRFPRSGYLRIEDVDGLDLNEDLAANLFDGSDHFTYTDGDLPEFSDSHGVEVVVPHFWIQERMPLSDVDTEARVIRSDYRTILSLRDGSERRFARYYLDGVVDELGGVSGEWYLDRGGLIPTGTYPKGAGRARVFYVPRQGDQIDYFSATIPVVGQLFSVRGTAGAPVRNVRFEGISLRFADFPTCPAAFAPFQMREDPALSPDVAYASDPQAAATIPGAVEFAFAHSCVLLACTIEHVGGYAVHLGFGSQYTLISGCTLEDLGAGGVSCGGSEQIDTPGFVRGNEISDNIVRSGGRIYPHCVAILLRHGSHNVVAHNTITDFYSSGISVGWTWDYGTSCSTDNLVEGNHLYDLGQGVLDWFGAIYTLGVSPGTVVRGNLIHDITAATFGGWGILVDPASSHILIEGNTVHTVSHEAIHIKSGRENIVRGNILAFGGTGQISIAVPENHVAATIYHNIIVGCETPAFSGAPGSAAIGEVSGLRSDLNLIWDVSSGQNALLAGDFVTGSAEHTGAAFASRNEVWRSGGRDSHSVVSDPGIILTIDSSLAITRLDDAERWGIPVPPARTYGPRVARARRHPNGARVAPYDSRNESSP